MTQNESVYAPINSEVKLIQFGGKRHKERRDFSTTSFNDDDELEHCCYPNGTQTIVIVIVVLVEIVTNRDDDDERRTRTRETFKTKSGENKDESE